MTGELVSADEQREIEQLLFHEARLLEAGELAKWLELFTSDVRYVLPVRQSSQPRDEGATDRKRSSFALYDDDHASLTLVGRIATGKAHAEVPHSVTQRLITNVTARCGEADGCYVVQSSFLVYQERRGRYGATFVGNRVDRLRREAGRLKIADRRIDLAQTILPTTISIFF